MRRMLIVIGVVLGFLGMRSQAEDVRIGYVDMQKALLSVDAGKKAKSQLETEFNKKKQEFEKEETALQKQFEEFQKQSLVMTDQAKAKKQNELQERYVKLQRQKASAQMEFQKREQEMTEPIINHLKNIIKDISKKKGYTTVLERNENTVLYFQEKDDLTGDVIQVYNKNPKG